VITREVFVDIKAMNRNGLSIRRIAKITGLHRKTVKRHLESTSLHEYHKTKRKGSILDPFRPMIDAYLEEDDYQASWIFDKLAGMGYTGGYTIVKDAVREIKERNLPSRRRSKVLYTTMSALVARLKESPARVKPYLAASLVVVDEAGYLPVNANEAHLFFQFVSSRYEKASAIITSNKSFIDWQELFGDQVIASAILDRLAPSLQGHQHQGAQLQVERQGVCSAAYTTTGR